MDRERKPFAEAVEPLVRSEHHVDLLLRERSKHAQPCNNKKWDRISEARLPFASVSKSLLQSVQERWKRSGLVSLYSFYMEFICSVAAVPAAAGMEATVGI